MQRRATTASSNRRRLAGAGLAACALWFAWTAVAGAALPAAAATTGTITGTVRDTAGAPVFDAAVSLAGSTATPVRTDQSGHYAIDGVPFGTHTVDVRPVCKRAVSSELDVDGAERLDVTTDERNTTDTFGYACRRSGAEIFSGTHGIGLVGDDAAASVPLPFSFPFYGTPRTTAFVSTNGFVSFTGPSTAFTNTAIPDAAGPNAAIYAFWDDLVVDNAQQVQVGTFGFAPFRQFVIHWDEVRLRNAPAAHASFEIILAEDGSIEMRYIDIDAGPDEEGASATMGIEDDTGRTGVQEGFDVRHLPVTFSASGVRYEPNRAPDAVAEGIFGTRKPGQTLPLDGTRSVDRDGDVLRYTWKQTSGPATVIADPTSPKTSAKAPKKSVSFELRVVDSYGASDTASVVVTVAPK
ncbi:MAG: carboxypeptidase regulatory-like domain-containing protein [Acidimicrobiia bacterium]|nr:carboxypeptidase regulatory-like domain-containing protein [Acidimicrobiia bacterium]